MSIEVTGKVIAVMPTAQVSDKFRKREFVIETPDEKYPQTLLLQVTQDNCNKLDSIKVGETVTASLNLRGRAWTNPQGEVKYFNTLEAWSVKTHYADVNATAQAVVAKIDGASDLPF